MDGRNNRLDGKQTFGYAKHREVVHYCLSFGQENTKAFVIIKISIQ